MPGQQGAGRCERRHPRIAGASGICVHGTHILNSNGSSSPLISAVSPPDLLLLLEFTTTHPQLTRLHRMLLSERLSFHTALPLCPTHTEIFTVPLICQDASGPCLFSGYSFSLRYLLWIVQLLICQLEQHLVYKAFLAHPPILHPLSRPGRDQHFTCLCGPSI